MPVFLLPAAAALVILLAFYMTGERRNNELQIRLLEVQSGRVVEMPLESYLVGVVLAEMPADFHMEALKAQAVCARTYALKRCQYAAIHRGGAPLCDESRHCQAYRSPSGYPGWKVRRAEAAVKATPGLVITWRGRLADPVFHSTCGGHTRDGGKVWSGKAPYLKGVPCRWDSHSPFTCNRTLMPEEKVRQLLGIPAETQLTHFPLRLGAQDEVIELSIGGLKISGQEARNKLGLASSKFTVVRRGKNLEFETRGFGHGVGMCQYGADGMAREGKNYEQILGYYFEGVAIQKLLY